MLEIVCLVTFVLLVLYQLVEYVAGSIKSKKGADETPMLSHHGQMISAQLSNAELDEEMITYPKQELLTDKGQVSNQEKEGVKNLSSTSSRLEPKTRGKMGQVSNKWRQENEKFPPIPQQAIEESMIRDSVKMMKEQDPKQEDRQDYNQIDEKIEQQADDNEEAINNESKEMGQVNPLEEIENDKIVQKTTIHAMARRMDSLSLHKQMQELLENDDSLRQKLLYRYLSKINHEKEEQKQQYEKRLKNAEKQLKQEREYGDEQIKRRQEAQLRAQILEKRLEEFKEKQIEKIDRQEREQKQKISLLDRIQQLQGQLKSSIQTKNSQIQQLRSDIQVLEIGKQEPNQRQSLWIKKLQAKESEYIQKLNYMEEDLEKVRQDASKYHQLCDALEYKATEVDRLLTENQQLRSDISKYQLTNENLKTTISQFSKERFRESRLNGEEFPQEQQPDENQMVELKQINEQLRAELEFCQKQIEQCYQTEQQLKNQLFKSEETAGGEEVSQLRAQVAKMKPILEEYNLMQKRYFQMKIKLERIEGEKGQQPTFKRSPINQSPEGQGSFERYSYPSQKSPANSYGRNSGISVRSDLSNRKTSTVIYYGFLSDCQFIHLEDRQFVYQVLHKLIRGVFRTQKLYSSVTHRGRNFHEFTDDIRGILLMLHLQNGKILGAYTHEPFTSSSPHSTANNIAFIFDITNRKSFTNVAGLNSINYHHSKLIWGFNQILINNEQPDVVYTNFCSSHNIFWDNKYKIEDFIGDNKQWARLKSYEIYRIIKI